MPTPRRGVARRNWQSLASTARLNHTERRAEVTCPCGRGVLVPLVPHATRDATARCYCGRAYRAEASVRVYVDVKHPG